MTGVRGSIVAVLLGVVALAGCGGGSSDDASSGDADNASSSTASATDSTGAAGRGLDGLYILTGTQSCKSALGPGSTSFPLFAGSTIAVDGDHATATLRSDPPEAAWTVEGNLFHVNVTYDATTNAAVTTVAGAVPSALDLVLDLSGTISDDGATITGTGYDSGVNCEYQFTGSRSAITGGPGPAGERCGGEEGLAQAVAAEPREDALTFSAEDVVVVAKTPDGQVARYTIGQSGAEGFAGCESTGWKVLADGASVRAIVCGYMNDSDLAAHLELDCATSTPTTVPAVTSPTSGIAAGCDAPGALAKTIELHPDTVARSLDFVLACEDGWAVVTYGTGDADLMELLEQRDGLWIESENTNVCTAPEVPEPVSFLICMTG